MNEQECLDNLKQKKEACGEEARTGSLEEYREIVQAARDQLESCSSGEITSGQEHTGNKKTS